MFSRSALWYSQPMTLAQYHTSQISTSPPITPMRI